MISRIRSSFFAACVVMFTAMSMLPARAEEPAPAKLDPAKLKIEFADGKVSVNGTKLTLPIEKKELVRLLDKPDRVLPQANTLLIWDDLGVLAYQRPSTEQIRALHITLDREAIQDRPKKLFTGTVKVEGAVITAESKLDAINTAIKPKAFVLHKDLSNVLQIFHWTLAYKDCVVFLREAEPMIKRKNANFSSLQIDQKE